MRKTKGVTAVELTLLLADAAKNSTLFVQSHPPVAPSERAALADRLMRRLSPAPEQVAFVCPPRMGGAGRIEMMGGEFCGNATRSYGLWLATQQGATGPVELTVEVSGCDRPLAVLADPVRSTARCALPPPLAVEPVTLGGVTGSLVRLEGIVHAVLPTAPDPALLDLLERRLGGEAEAFGVIFLQEETLSMTPLVRVVAVGSTVWEQSCGSGSVAAALHLTAARRAAQPDGRRRLALRQPGGVIEVELGWAQGAVTEVLLGGAVTLGQPWRLDNLA